MWLLWLTIVVFRSQHVLGVHLFFFRYLLLVVLRSQPVLGVHHTGEGEAVAGRTENLIEVNSNETVLFWKTEALFKSWSISTCMCAPLLAPAMSRPFSAEPQRQEYQSQLSKSLSLSDQHCHHLIFLTIIIPFSVAVLSHKNKTPLTSITHFWVWNGKRFLTQPLNLIWARRAPGKTQPNKYKCKFERKCTSTQE